jgi:hypothetical protein
VSLFGVYFQNLTDLLNQDREAVSSSTSSFNNEVFKQYARATCFSSKYSNNKTTYARESIFLSVKRNTHPQQTMFRKLSQKLGKNFGRKIMLLAGAGAGMSFFLADARARQEYLLTKEKPKRAVCVMRGNGVYGIAHFGQAGDKFPVEIRASFSGLTPGKYTN